MKFFMTNKGVHEFKKWINANKWVYDQKKVLNQIYNWKKCLPWIKPYYALKSNPSIDLVETITSNTNIGLDASSLFEVQLAKKYTNDIIYTNPHLLQDHSFLLDNVNYIVIDDLNELKRAPNLNILLRMNSGIQSANCSFDSKFGCSQSEAYDMIDYALENKKRICGISFHIGSGGNHDRKYAYITSYTYSKPILDYLQKNCLSKPILNIGGGLLSSTDLTETLGWTKHLPYNMIAEPGRYYSEPAYHLITQVIAKTRRGIFLDNGAYHELNVYYRDHWRFPRLTQCYDNQTDRLDKVKEYEDVQLFGPTCDSYDTIGFCNVPKSISVGDCIFLENMGAYTSAGSCNFNGISSASFQKEYVLNKI
jgi:ornithine decarboxylase